MVSGNGARERPTAGAAPTGGRAASAWRDEIVSRFLELRPTVLARMQASIPPELHAELESVTGRQLQALTRLPPAGLTMRCLAKSLGVSGAAACVLADRLAAQGLVERQTDPEDRRVVRLVPSTRGDVVARRYLEAQRHAVSALLARLSDAQVAAWIEIMETLGADADDGCASADCGATGVHQGAGRPAGPASAETSGPPASARATGTPTAWQPPAPTL